MSLIYKLMPPRSQLRPLLIYFALVVGLGLTCLLSLILFGVIYNGRRAPERSFQAAALFPPESAYPLRYHAVSPPAWAGDTLGYPSWDIAEALYRISSLWHNQPHAYEYAASA